MAHDKNIASIKILFASATLSAKNLVMKPIISVQIIL